MHSNVLVVRIGVFVLMVLASFLVTDTQRTIFLKPFGTHTWRQSDSASQFRNYYQNGGTIGKPQLMNQTGRNGVAVAEFPITYFVAAQLAKVFGYSEAWCRALHLLLLISASFSLYFIALRFIENALFALIPALCFLNLPLNYFYGNNFLPNVPAISLVIMGWYYYFRFQYDGRSSAIIWMLFFMTLGALIKASEAIHLIAAFLSLLHAKYWRKEDWPQGGAWGVWFGTAIGIACVAGWVMYAKATNQAYGNNMSLLGIFPIWDMSQVDRSYTWKVLKTIWAPVIASKVNWVLTAGLFAGMLWPKVWRSDLFMPSILLFLGSAAYSLLWYKAFMIHDYYLLTMLVFPIFFLMLLLEQILKHSESTPWLFLSAMIVFLAVGIHTIAYNGKMQHKRMDPAASEIDSAFYTLEGSLRALGVDREDRIISVPDPSPNISLYMANNPGWTDCLNGGINNPAPYIRAGAKFLVGLDTSIQGRPGMAPYLTDTIGTHGPFVIYRLKEIETQ